MKHLLILACLLPFAAVFSQGSKTSPVKLNAVRVVLDKDGKDKHVEIDFTNTSKKKIKTVRFTWLEESAGGKVNSKVQHGDITDLYKPGKSATAKFGTDDPQLQSVKELIVTGVTYEDGTAWKLPAEQ